MNAELTLQSQLLEVVVSEDEREKLAKILVADLGNGSTIRQLSEYSNVRPMRLARQLEMLRETDQALTDLVNECERNIRFFGKFDVTEEEKEAAWDIEDRGVWKDPLKLQKLGDDFYIDENSRIAVALPWLILAPTGSLIAFLTLLWFFTRR